MKKWDVDKKTLISVLLFAVPMLTLLGLGLKYDQDHNLSGIVDYKAGRNQEAIQELQGYLKDHPCTMSYSMVNGKPQLARKYLGLAYLKAHQDQQAVEVFKDPCIGSSNSQYSLGVALLRLGKLQEARAAFTQCIDMEAGGGKFTDAKLMRDADAEIAKIDKLR